ncbi:hypothetical protein [Polaribacter sp. KT25b]|uniref:hypothetical protein n=1 Tax=Polaribacter sp. KT25b TaxID=1855336 RepID=UPI001E3B8EBD|nr:hypothetical protein [Polaribacter sp. KT25b]
MKKLLILFLQISITNCSKKTIFKVGVIAECKYCDSAIKWNRYYKILPQRLKDAANKNY